MVKSCSKCKLEKPLDSFNKRGDKKGVLGLQSHCKDCVSIQEKLRYDPEKQKEQNQKYYQSKKEQDPIFYRNEYQLKGKKHRLKREYGITFDDYMVMFETQNGVCKICSRPERIINRSLTVDHCHKTGQVRGLLCFDCNTALGKFQDDPEILDIAIKYLKGALSQK